MPVNFMPTGTDYFRILPEIIMTIGGTLIMLIEGWLGENKKRNLSAFTFVVFAAALVAAIAANGSPGLSFSNMLIVDGFATFFRVLVIGVGILSLLSAVQYLKREHSESSEYYALLLFSVTGQCIMATANELIMIFIGLEISSIATYILAGYLRDDKRNNEAALKYFLLGSFATAFLLYGIAWIYGTTGSTNLRCHPDHSALRRLQPQRDPGRHRGGADVRRIRFQSFGRAIPDLGARRLSRRARAGDAVHVRRSQGCGVRGFPARVHDGLRAHQPIAGNHSYGRRLCSP